MRVALVVLSASLFIWPSRATADHCPDASVTPGKSDLVLAGVDLTSARIEDVVERFGAPSSTLQAPVEDAPAGSGAADHVWHIGGATVTASTEFYHDGSGRKVESVLVLRVQGPGRAPSLRTGRGAGLGDSPGRIKSLYGRRALTEPVNASAPAGTVMAYCFTDESELVFGIEHGRVTSIMLYVSEE